MSLIEKVTRDVLLPRYSRQAPSKTPPKVVYPNGSSLLPKLGVRTERLEITQTEVVVLKGQSLLAPVKLAFFSDIHMDELIQTGFLGPCLIFEK